MRKIIKIALPIIACLVITLVVTNMNGLFSSANEGDTVKVTLHSNIMTSKSCDYFFQIDDEQNELDCVDSDDLAITITDVSKGNYTLPTCPFISDEYIFIGWGKEADDEDSIIETNSITLDGDLDLYAYWDYLQVVEKPSASNGYKVITNASPLIGGEKNAFCCCSAIDKDNSVPYASYIEIEGTNYLEPGNRVEIHFSSLDKLSEVRIHERNTSNYTCYLKEPDQYSSQLESSIIYTVQDTTDVLEIDLTDGDDYEGEISFSLLEGDCELYVTLDDCLGVEGEIFNTLLTELTQDTKYVCDLYFINGFSGCNWALATINKQIFTFGEVKTSSSKKYKAKTTTDSGEKISGSGKKNSTRTITPIEGKKVQDVIVTDKDGNKVDVTLNEDGTYSFKQPASNVDVQIVYKNREIKLEIGSTNIDVDGEVSNTGVAPLVRNDRTMFPIRFVAENLGAKVGWEEKNPNVVTISKGDVTIVVHLGSNKVEVNGKEYEIDAVAFAENDRTYLPVRFISEHLNADVIWNEQNPSDILIKEK